MYENSAVPSSATPYAQYSTHAEFPTGSRMVTGQTMGQERLQSTRKVSSTVVNEQYMGPAPVDLPTREIEVPGPIQEVIKHVPRKEVVETEKRVPRYEIEWVDRIVEIPKIEYRDKFRDVPVITPVPKYVPKIQVVDRPYEVKHEVKKIVKVPVHKTREVPGEIIEVPQPYKVEQRVEINRYVDRAHPVVVAQTVKPCIVEGSGTYEVDVYEYEPECIPIEVHVIKAVQAQVQAHGIVEQSHKVIAVPAAQYNTILHQLNPHLSQVELQKLPYMAESNGQVTFLNERVSYTEPQPGVAIQGLERIRTSVERVHVDQTSRRVQPVYGPDGTILADGGATYSTTTTEVNSLMPNIYRGNSTAHSQYNKTITTTTAAASTSYPAISTNIMNREMSANQHPIPTPILAATSVN